MRSGVFSLAYLFFVLPLSHAYPTFVDPAVFRHSEEKVLSELEFITEESQIYTLLGTHVLLGAYLKIDKNTITILTSNENQSKFVEDSIRKELSKIKEYYKKERVIVTVQEGLEDIGKKSRPTEIPESVPDKKEIARGALEGQLNSEFLETEFVVGEPNRLAVAMKDKMIREGKPSVMYLFGFSGTGKSHLFHRTADELLKKGEDVFLCGASDLAEMIKESFKEKTNFVGHIQKFSTVFIEDAQRIKKVSWVEPVLFEIFNHIIDTGRKLFISSDEEPHKTTMLYHERLQSRVRSGFTANMTYPDKEMKEAFIKNFCEKNDLILSEEITSHVVNVARSCRFAKGILEICRALDEISSLSLKNLLQAMQSNFGGQEDTAVADRTRVIRQLQELLEGYFEVYINREPAFLKTQKRKSSEMVLVDSIIFYLLSPKMKRNFLTEALHMTGAKGKGAYYQREGAKNFASLNDPALLGAIDKILRDNFS